jgi:putative transposase
MPRRPRFASGGYVFHVLNRAAGRRTIFSQESDFLAFERVLHAASERAPMRLLAYCMMPTHWHLVLWPQGDDDLSEYLRWLTVTHTQRWHQSHGTAGTGPLYQGRFKSFPVETDDHFYRVCRYVERNPLRANLVTQAENWRWSSLWQWKNTRCDVICHPWPLERPSDWLAIVQSPQTEVELQAIRNSLLRGRPYGNSAWRRDTAMRLGLRGAFAD